MYSYSAHTHVAQKSDIYLYTVESAPTDSVLCRDSDCFWDSVSFFKLAIAYSELHPK